MPMNRSFTIIPLLLLCSVIALAQEQMDTIKASKVTSDLMRTISFSQTGHERMESLRFEVAPVLGSPDIIRTLQGLPGVAMGNEMSSGLYVRGGDGSDNLYMFDGAPVWQTAHMGGMFSVVNSDILDNVDVYKSFYRLNRWSYYLGWTIQEQKDFIPRFFETELDVSFHKTRI